MKYRFMEFPRLLFVIVVMSLLILVTKTDVKAAYNPTGCVDFVRTGLNSVAVGGWAFDKDQMSKSIDIHVYVKDSDSGREYGVSIGSANGHRPDVNNAYGCGSYHGFAQTFNVPSNYSGKRQEVYVYAINIYGGSNVLLGHQSVYIPSESRPTEGNDPTGSLDLVSAGLYQVSVGGWAFDKDSLSKSLEIHVYVSEGSNEYGLNIGLAQGYRPDVGKVYGCGSYHGFTSTFNVPEKLCGKRQEVYVYAINIYGGNNVLIGHKSVYIPSASQSKENVSNVSAYIAEVQENFNKISYKKSSWSRKCPALVYWQLYAKGLVNDYDPSSAYGKNMAREYAAMGRTKAGYKLTGFSCTKSSSASLLRNLISTGYSGNIIVSFSGNAGSLGSDGHVMLIYRIVKINGTYYCCFIDNTTYCASGNTYKAVSMTLDEYISKYLNHFYANYMTVVG